jgi:hypothetical protein
VGAATAPTGRFDCFCSCNALRQFQLPTATFSVVLSSPPRAATKSRVSGTLQDLHVFLYGVFVTETLGLRDRKKLETWRAIRSAAVEPFLQRGYEAVSVDDIAAAAM